MFNKIMQSFKDYTLVRTFTFRAFSFYPKRLIISTFVTMLYFYVPVKGLGNCAEQDIFGPCICVCGLIFKPLFGVKTCCRHADNREGESVIVRWRLFSLKTYPAGEGKIERAREAVRS